MNSNILAFVACRLMAIYMFVNLVHNVGMTIIVRATNAPESISFSDVFSVFLAYLTLVIILWFAARWISKHVANEAFSENVKGQWSHTNVLSVSMCIMGMFIVVMALPQFTFLLRLHSFGILETADPLMSLFLGLLLIFGAEQVAAQITKSRRW